MKTTQKQSGSAHIVIVIVLVVVLVGALGFVFWQNFIKKDDKVATSDVSKQVDKPAVAADTSTELSQTQCATQDPVCFKYPKDWTVSSSTESGWEKTTVKNKNGTSLVTYNVEVSGIGGTGVTHLQLYVDKVGSTTITATAPYGDSKNTVIVPSGVANEYITESDAKDYGNAAYSKWYPLAYLISNDANVQAGQTIDSSFFAPLSGFKAKTLLAGGDNIYGSNGASVTWPTDYATKDEALKAYQTDDFQTAYRILQSTYYK